MSIKKLAKSINNLADAIRYHADGGRTLPLTEGDRIESEGKETPQPLTEAEENFVDPYDAPPKATVTDAGWVLPPQPKTGAPAVVKALDGLAPPRVNDPKFMAGFSEGLVPAFQMSDGKSLNDAPPPPVVENDAPDFSDNTNPVDAPGWQTLTVEELDAAPPSVETDADGLPWDERIHSGGKTLLVDGTWRLKRGVPDDEYQEVVAELKKLMAIPTPSEPDMEAVAYKALREANGIPEKTVDNTPPPPPNASAPVPPAPSVTVDNLPAFIKAVTGAQLDKDVVLAAVKNAGLENVMQLGARPDLIAGIAKELGL